jgi:hypothetical protein
MDQVTGLLPESVSAFVNDRDFRTVTSRSEDRDVARFDYFQAYVRENFCDGLIPGMGTEQILDFFQRFGSGRWLDLGCGPSTYLWSCAMDSIESIVAVDVVPEALMVLLELREGRWSPPCYGDVLQRYDRQLSHLERMYLRPLDCLAFDFSKPWPMFDHEHRFDLISAIGSFGLSSDPSLFQDCVGHAAPLLEEHGVILGANWLRTDTSLARDGYDTRFLTADFISASLRDHGISPVALEVAPIRGSERYASILVWAGRKAGGTGSRP